MKLKLIRKYKKSNYTIGKLYINDVYFCDTLEDKYYLVIDNNIFTPIKYESTSI